MFRGLTVLLYYTRRWFATFTISVEIVAVTTLRCFHTAPQLTAHGDFRHDS